MEGISTLADIVAVAAARDGEHPAIIFGNSTITYAALDQAIEQVAAALAGQGVRQGDRVALLLPNCPQFIVAYYATARIGAVVVPINVLYKSEEIAYILDDCAPHSFLFWHGFAHEVAGALTHLAAPPLPIVVGGRADAIAGVLTWEELLRGALPEAPQRHILPNDLVVICYTSGTTGRSKGAMLTHRNFVANLEQLSQSTTIAPIPSDSGLLALPLFHIYAMNVAMNGLLAVGSTIVLLPRFEATAVLQAIQTHRCTLFWGAPPMFVAWVNLPDLEAYNLSSLRGISSGAAPLPMEVLHSFEARTHCTILEGYGLTETAPVLTSNAVCTTIKAGTIGAAMMGVDIRLVDDDDRDVPLGLPGELICRGENVTMGYWNRPEETADALRGGWFHTGDIATLDSEGYYTIVDRKKDMINAGGFKVWPREVEEVLYHHPAIREAAVVPFPDAYAGERPLAYIALREGQHLDAADVIDYCRHHLATFKVPVRVEILDELPRLPTGKVLRRDLRAQAAQLARSEHVMP